MKNSTMNRRRPLPVQTSTVKKSAATISSQCCVRNSFQHVLQLRSGAGPCPFGEGCEQWCSVLLYGRDLQGRPEAGDIPLAVLLRHLDHQLFESGSCSGSARTSISAA